MSKKINKIFRSFRAILTAGIINKNRPIIKKCLILERKTANDEEFMEGLEDEDVDVNIDSI